VTRTSTRDIARSAVRAELAQVALDLVRREGYENITVNDLAAAAGVSRSTFLRYIGGKEEAVLSAFEARGEQVAEALRARPDTEDDWTALRRALDALMERYRQDPQSALEITRLVQDTPALCARHLEKQKGWRPTLAKALAERTGKSEPTLAHAARASAALECLNVALDHWTASDGRLDLPGLVDEAFTALAF
jgi:AcrR family transcriptional regulator